MVRIVILGTALTLASTQAAGADSLRPNADAGGAGGGSSSTTVYYELEYEQARPVVIEQAQTGTAERAAVEAAAREAQTWPSFDSTSVVVQQPNAGASDHGWYAIVDEHGNVSVAEQVTNKAASSQDVYYAIAHEHGNGTFAEQASEDSATSDVVRSAIAADQNLRSIQMIEGKQASVEVAQPASVNAYSVCVACSSLR